MSRPAAGCAALVFALWVAGASFGPAQDLPPGTLVLARTKARVRQSLEHLPDCTCVENIQRFQKRPGRNEAMEPLDTLRLQILFSGDKELYLAPGTSQWESHPGTFIGRGMIGDGVFALHLKTVFTGGQADFVYRGENSDFRPGLPHFDFRVPVMSSGYVLSSGSARGVAGIKGSVWINAEAFDVVRLEMHADDIPPNVPFEEATTIIDYARVRIGSADVLLPQTAVMATASVNGQASRNVMEFSDCREFHADSTVRFESAAGKP